MIASGGAIRAIGDDSTIERTPASNPIRTAMPLWNPMVGAGGGAAGKGGGS